jgi:DNA-binding NtrC family response regulator/tetratricopeptide (TPR) repeat protein
MKHSKAGQSLLSRDPNLWLEATSENTQAAISIMLSNFDEALHHGQRARSLAEESGVMSALVASLGNLGNLHFHLGRFEEAADYLHNAISLAGAGSENSTAVRETLAQIYIADGRAAEATELLDQIECALPVDDARGRYVFRHTQLTRAKLLLRQERWADALASTNEVITLAEQSGDILLRSAAIAVKAELFIHSERLPEALSLLDAVVPELPRQSASLYAEYEGLLGLASAKQSREVARAHLGRALRVFQHLRNAPSSQELTRKWIDVAKDKEGELSAAGDASPSQAVRDAFQAVTMMLLHARKPGVVAEQLIELTKQLDCCEVARAHVVSTDEARKNPSEWPDGAMTGPALSDMFTLLVDERTNIRFEIQSKGDVESRATVNAIALFLSTIQELERARVEREERLTLWPIEDVPVMNDHAVVNGKMRELMTTARRVATTDISVLLTGESGTGKEILARAIHTLSNRADQPFVPFNCAALPRDMLESQLFGHRRGAFTGADRDNPGVIRAARGGTLFLDEIGELNIDLQPKLLRFLESGEICPLGETTPFTVKVRIIAATNARLDEAVKAGRFREDLFYRLNVVRLQIPPLRDRRDELPPLVHHFVTNAAIEYRKGQIRIAENTMERLLLAPWPGNIRQLQNELRRMIALADTDAILTPAALSTDVADDAAAERDAAFAPPFNGKLNPTLARLEREMIHAALQQHQGKMDAAAKALGISRKGLYLKRQRLGL